MYHPKINLDIWTSMCAGFVAGLLFLYLTPSTAFHNSLTTESSQPDWMKVQFQISRLLQQTAVQVAGVGIMGFMTFRRRQKSDGRIYAFLFGLSLAMVAGHFINTF